MSNGPPWTDEERAYLRASWPAKTMGEIGKKLGRPAAGVKAQLTAMGLRGETEDYEERAIRLASERFAVRRSSQPPAAWAEVAEKRRDRVALALQIARERGARPPSQAALARALRMSQAAVSRALKRIQNEAPRGG